jgi:hypothetical protein
MGSGDDKNLSDLQLGAAQQGGESRKPLMQYLQCCQKDSSYMIRGPFIVDPDSTRMRHEQSQGLEE